MRVGVVCEGPTDFLAIESFLKASLSQNGIMATFIDIQPQLDATSTSSGGGWSNALMWLLNNPPKRRQASYLGQGLFANGLSQKTCDFILVQIDTDVLDEDSFQNFVYIRIGHSVTTKTDPEGRFDEVQHILLLFAGYKEFADAMNDNHVIAPAVENTDTWCVAVRDPVLPGLETLSKSHILTELTTRMAAFEAGTAKPRSAKNVNRRRAYCSAHVHEVSRVEAHCSQYTRLVSYFL